jgi:pyruvate/2-oxoglutarate dehydrogenase complex dihydrolipoamide dehydrogenase (E3) component
MSSLLEAPPVQPLDKHNRTLIENVHPLDWVNPTPTGRYNMVVLGAGTAGLVTAAGAAGLGAKVALIERTLMGGDCLNVGCVPSKALIRCARAYAHLREASDFGIQVPENIKLNFPAVMERMRRLRAQISQHDSASRFRDLGVDIYLGEARFTGSDTVEVGGQELQFTRACIATGTRPLEPPIPGLDTINFLTNETIFSLTELPQRLAVLGAGPIGCELAQTFARFGTQVWLIELQQQVLPREDPDAAARIAETLAAEGVKLQLQTKLVSVQPQGKHKQLVLETAEGQQALEVDELLLSVGRVPNVEALNLEAAGVEYDSKTGVHTNDRLQTANRRIFAAGDVGFPYQFTHTADATARVVIQNALFFGRAKASALTIPWCTYTDPEVAHVGLSPAQAEEQGISVQTHCLALSEVDRAVLDGQAQGFLKVHVKEGSDRILGATLVASHAGEMISELTLAMQVNAGLSTLAKTIHPYPTQAEVFRQAGDTYNRLRLTPWVKKLLTWYFSWRR